MMKKAPLFSEPGPGLSIAGQNDHLRQLCLFRRHVSALIEVQETRTPVWHSLCQFRDALDRYQSIYTGDLNHFELSQEQTPAVRGVAND